MAVFATDEEVYEYIGGIFEKADEHPEVGPKLRAAQIKLRLDYSEPDASMVVKLQDPITVVRRASADEPADVTLTLPADLADRYWRGNYNLAIGLAKGEVKAKGPVTKILKLVPLTKPLFAIYQDLVAHRSQ